MRQNHYEQAFASYLDRLGWPWVPVREVRRALYGRRPLKSFDFLVYPPGRPAWIAEIKGRRFPYPSKGGNRYWENWVTRRDLDDLARWEDAFGAGFVGVVVFAYQLRRRSEERHRATWPAAHEHAGRTYAFVWLNAADYAKLARERSPQWQTVTLPVREFRRAVRPVT